MFNKEKSVYSVSQFNNLIKSFIDEIPPFRDVFLKGELSNVKYYQKGRQLYFNLSDGNSVINCVMYDTFLKQLKFDPKNGDEVVIRGKLNLFVKRGSLSFQVAHMALAGQGELKQNFEKLKAKLLKEGLFDPNNKKKIPQLPAKIALITSYDSAAMWDFVTIARETVPSMMFYVIPSTVQGESAPRELINALDTVEQCDDIDLVVMMRGGGSAEDLACFNDEALVRKMAECSHPLISAIGHEIDYTLADFVADMRAATDAAKLVVSSYMQVILQLQRRCETTFHYLNDKIEESREEIYQRIEDFQSHLNEEIVTVKESLNQKLLRLEQANPLHKLKQGFSITRLESDSTACRSISKIKKGDVIETEIYDGVLLSKVHLIKEKL